MKGVSMDVDEVKELDDAVSSVTAKVDALHVDPACHGSLWVSRRAEIGDKLTADGAKVGDKLTVA